MFPSQINLLQEVLYMEKYILSNMDRKNFSKAVNEIYLSTDYNHKQYPEYLKWFFQKSIPRIFNGTGEIIFFLNGLSIGGLAILKNDIDEKKICTLLISDEFKRKGYGSLLLEDSFKFLGTEQPVITIPTYSVDDFSAIIQHYNWKESCRTSEYLSEEIVFNNFHNASL